MALYIPICLYPLPLIKVCHLITQNPIPSTLISCQMPDAISHRMPHFRLLDALAPAFTASSFCLLSKPMTVRST